MLEPERAHLKVMSEAIIFARYLTGKANNIHQLADLLDAIHNSAEHIQKPICKNSEYVSLYYESYDKKWSKSGISLVEIYKSIDPSLSEV